MKRETLADFEECSQMPNELCCDACFSISSCCQQCPDVNRRLSAETKNLTNTAIIYVELLNSEMEMYFNECPVYN